MGQYIQDGRKNIFETSIEINNDVEYIKLDSEKNNIDNFNYLDGFGFNEINRAAYHATVKAHFEGGVPCVVVGVPKLDEYYFGQIFYFFMLGCYLSCELLGVNPFDQPGVEAYKINMFNTLRGEK